MSEAVEQKVFSPSPDAKQNVNQASPRQWQLLESVLMASQKEQAQSAKQEAPETTRTSYQGKPGASSMAQEPPAPKFSMLTALGLLVVIFGIVILALSQLSTTTEKPQSNKEKK